MKKVLFTAISMAFLVSTGSAQAKNINATVSSKSVNYTCQSGKSVRVTYGFNRQGLPTYASSYIAGKSRYMPINLDRSDNVDTVFGKESAYTLSSDNMNSRNYRNASIMVTAPTQEILFKDCRAH